MEEWSVCRSTDVDVDFAIFDLWLNGKRSKDILELRFNNKLRFSFTDEVILSHIKDQIHLFQFLKTYLEHPWHFVVIRHQLNSQVRNRLISAYYTFNHMFARELLNHRISSKLRKDVDEIATKLKVPLFPCFRYFDNIRIVLNKFEDFDGGSSVLDFMKQVFSMNEDLARQYTTIVFLQHFKFDIGRKRMQFLTFDDLCSVSLTVLQFWSCGQTDESGDILDRDLFSRLHECKSLDNESLSMLTDMIVVNFSQGEKVFSEILSSFENLDKRGLFL